MNYKLIASDVDGTLVNDNSELTERTRNAIIKAVDAGILFVTATGRPFSNIGIVNDLFDKDMPFIVFNGAAAYLGKSKKLLFEKFLDFEIAKEAYDMGEKRGIAQIVWTGPRLWTNRICERTSSYESFGTAKMSVISQFDDFKDMGEKVSKVLWIDDPATIKLLGLKMTEHFGDRLNCFSSMSHFLEFVGNDVSKGTALAEIGRLYGIDRSEMISVGDSFNDVSMLEYAGLGVAVENAPEKIKAICDHVTTSNNNDGVAEVIERIFTPSTDKSS